MDEADRDESATGVEPAGSLAILTNREPYSHRYDGDGVAVERSDSGLAVALDSVMGRLGGTWIAWGSGEADFAVTDADDAVALPPDEGAYRLRRLRLSRDERANYYYGYSNQVLWPLLHVDTNYVDVRPGFWDAYRRVNDRFAAAAVESDADALWVHDYHLLLVPRLVRERGADGPVAFFLHVPWPATEQFRLCPHTTGLLSGVLGADAVGFHTDRYARNFLAAVEQFLPEATVDRGSGAVTYDGRTTTVYASPLGVDADRAREQATSEAASAAWRTLARRYGLDDETTVAVSVDRLDYTKGILERLDAFAHLWETRPELRGSLVLVQKGTRTRDRIPSYRRYHRAVADRVAEINDAFGTDDWQPVVFRTESLSTAALMGLYRHADVGVVSPRRDGMNLVAKEFVAASAGTASALVLSEFAGAADELVPPAIGINPYDVAGFADAIERAVSMPAADRRAQTAALVERVRERDVDRWIDEQLGYFRR